MAQNFLALIFLFLLTQGSVSGRDYFSTHLTLTVTTNPAGYFHIQNQSIEYYPRRKKGKIQLPEEIKIYVKDLDAGHYMRNQLMYKLLKIKHYPIITFYKIQLGEEKGSGILSLMGQKHKIHFQYEVSEVYFTAHFKLNLFKLIGKNISYDGLFVKPEIDGKIKIQFFGREKHEKREKQEVRD